MDSRAADLTGTGAFVTALRFFDLNFNAPAGAFNAGFAPPVRLM
jgi:hypothetical protein